MCITFLVLHLSSYKEACALKGSFPVDGQGEKIIGHCKLVKSRCQKTVSEYASEFNPWKIMNENKNILKQKYKLTNLSILCTYLNT